MLNSREHMVVKARTRETRNRMARARRAVQLVQALDHDGAIVLVALSQSRDGFAYVVKVDETGRLACSCPGYVWRQRCAHVNAAKRTDQPQPMAAPIATDQGRAA